MSRTDGLPAERAFPLVQVMSSEPKRILVAEDNPAMNNVIRFNLERVGYDVVAETNGADAAQRIDEQSFDLVFSDLQMPGMTGEQLCRHIRQTAGLKDLPIVICSAKGMEIDTARMTVEYGLSQVLCKPFSPVELVSLAKSILDRPVPVS